MHIDNGGYRVIFDKNDEEIILPHKWYVRISGGNYPYATARINGKQTPMHRHIMKPTKDFIVDHINHDTLDNRRINLRICTRSQNMWNRKRACGKSKHKGVCWHKMGNKWNAQIWINNKKTHLGLFVTERDAAIAYNNAAIKMFGSFACLNEIGD